MGKLKIIALLLVAAAATSVLAQERHFLSQTEVQTLAEGKKWSWVRARDGANQRIDLRSNGYVYFNNYSNNYSDSGTWSVNDKGNLCIKFRQAGNPCWSIFKESDKFNMVDITNLEGPSTLFNVE